MSPVRDSARRRPGPGLPPAIWALGLVSMFMDISSEMIHGLLPVYLTVVLGASVTQVGLIEGLAEATAAITKVFSGALSDWLGRRKLLAAVGYGLAAVTKPVFPLATTVGAVVAARFIDRVGKGVRGAPRDALVADISPPELRGAAFGLRQSLDTVGAFLGPALAMALMWLTGDRFRLVFWIACVPAVMGVAVILLAVKEPRHPPTDAPRRLPLRPSQLAGLGPLFWWVVSLGAVFTLARFSEAFLILRARALGAPVASVPAVLVAMNIAYAASAYPVGVLADRLGAAGLLIAGLVLLVLADLCLAFAPGWGALALGVILWGLHMGFSQGLLAALVAGAAPPDRRGTAFGVFNLVTGLAMLAASLIAGALWDRFGPQATFLAGAGFTVVTLTGLVVLRGRLKTA